MVKYKAAPASGALDPEIVLKEHMLKGTFREWVLVDMTVEETVQGIWKPNAKLDPKGCGEGCVPDQIPILSQANFLSKCQPEK